jgi:carbonic anhydrase
MKHHRILALVAGMFVTANGCDHEQDAGNEHCEQWSYEHGACGPPWDEEEAWAECSAGIDQSPVDIRGAVLDPTLDPLQVNYPPLEDPVVHNNGHTLQTDYQGGKLRLGEQLLGSSQFHVHVPAEHAVDGIRAAMELHIVHVDSKGAPAAVVALRFVEGEMNELLAELWQDAPDEPGEVEVEGSFELGELLPDSTAYWTYSGSLTTPPCSEGLRWIVLEQTGTVSREQIELVRDRFGENARALQPINNRPIAEFQP